jgi:hypothetical protein
MVKNKEEITQSSITKESLKDAWEYSRGLMIKWIRFVLFELLDCSVLNVEVSESLSSPKTDSFI